ncbi:S1C family serine protease [Aquibacillus saliphilus]|uniref:S1C family serine protease n=1 Tax=Aquibacillus saliphilus TaxID=1909422 RepID=UPI001CF019BA|nr:S1C family serine protease [Aquibacillus saliphilus]
MINNDDHKQEQEIYTPEKSNDQHGTQEREYLFENTTVDKNSYNNNQIVNQPPIESKQSKKNNSTSKWALFISGIVGGLTVATVGLLLIISGILPIDQQISNNQTGLTTSNNNHQSSDIIPAVASSNDGSLTSTLGQVSDAVVGVSNKKQTDLWSESQSAGTGSGVIYKKQDGSAYVVTNNHVVEGANEVEVILSTGENVSAQVLGADQLTDLAVLKIDGSKVTQVATLGTSGNLAVGDTAIAIGNPLGTEFAGSVTKGIISGLERSVDMDLNQDGQPDWTTEVIQTDAAINPGNSGGALINSSGEVIGINSMKVAQQAVEGIGFAIPIDEAKPIIDQLETDGQISRPFMGISAVSLDTVPSRNIVETLKLGDDVTEGIVIAQVQSDSPAGQAGLQQYDVITKVNDKTIASMLDLKEYLYSETEIGDEITITYYREGQEQTTALTLSEQG